MKKMPNIDRAVTLLREAISAAYAGQEETRDQGKWLRAVEAMDAAMQLLVAIPLPPPGMGYPTPQGPEVK